MKAKTLESLKVANNQFTDLGAKYFSIAIKSGIPALKHLNLSKNKIGDRGGMRIAFSIKTAGVCYL